MMLGCNAATSSYKNLYASEFRFGLECDNLCLNFLKLGRNMAIYIQPNVSIRKVILPLFQSQI